MKDNNYWINKWKKQMCNEVFEYSFVNITAGVCALPGAPHVILNTVLYTCNGCPYKKTTGGIK